MLIDGLEWSGLLVDYCKVFVSRLDSHSDGTHSLQIIQWWASDGILHFYKSVVMKKQTHLNLDGLRVNRCSANVHVWVNYTFKEYECVRKSRWYVCSWHTDPLTLQLSLSHTHTSTLQLSLPLSLTHISTHSVYLSKGSSHPPPSIYFNSNSILKNIHPPPTPPDSTASLVINEREKSIYVCTV